jgi:hypothetical protein
MDNEIPQTSPAELKPEKQGFKLERKYILMAALLIVAVAVTAVVYFMFIRTSEPDLLYDETAYLESFDAEALDRTLRGEDSQHIYSQNGKLLSIEGNSLTFRIETITEIDGINFVDFTDKTGKITNQTAIFKISSSPDDPVSLVVESATLSDIQISDEIDVRSFQNFLVLGEFDIHEIYIQP